MLSHLSKRLGYYALLLALAVVVSYALPSLALSPRGYFGGRRPPPPPAQVEARLTALGINDRTPLAERFRHWLGGARIGMVLQDPLSALIPVHHVGDRIAEAVRTQQDVSRAHAARRAVELLDLVGVPDPAGRARAHPHEFSGGMRQRALTTTAIANAPETILADEPTTALDVSSHDLSVIRHVADRVSVMYLGRTVESGPVDEVFGDPRHPYTRALLSAVPLPDPVRERERERVLLAGDPPSPAERQTGCGFRGRCPRYSALGAADRARCESEIPVPAASGRGTTAACHFPA
ncbi:oligopeptide/dipeptide ABC transporter ATP-binding protein [Streptomyces sp. NPDC050504]|uniref:oligopeptide/dipeptide ABC transporter ATP-binding protein n=1 Tax=Streptomyces sp. NPDC050504 TaxID=3365618 RepID=UPI0037897F37